MTFTMTDELKESSLDMINRTQAVRRMLVHGWVDAAASCFLFTSHAPKASLIASLKHCSEVC